MDEQTEFYKFSYLWKGCDHLMGFKEFVDIRRIAEQTWLEISSRGSVFERKLVGSMGDGIEFKRNGIDDLFIFKRISVLSQGNMKSLPVNMGMTLLANYVNPGYCILGYNTGPVFSDDLYDNDGNSRICFSSSKFIHRCLNLTSGNARAEGPVIVDDSQRTICALPVIGWPPVAKEWITRDRNRCWPEKETMNKVIFDGCHCVPVGHSVSTTKHLEWQLSFSVAECTLVHSMDHRLFKLYQILKILIHERLNNMDGCGECISSYMIKTLMFWMCEDKLPNFICAQNLRESIEECLTQLEEWIRKDFFPHYFIPERNLIEQKLRPLQKATILERILIMKSGVLSELLNCSSFKIVKEEVTAEPPLPVHGLDVASDDLKTKCEFVFFENVGSGHFSAMFFSRAKQVLRNFENAYSFDTLSDLQGSVVKQMYYRTANAAGKIAYRIVKDSHTNKRKYHFLRLSESFLKIGCSTDVTSGKLSLATLYSCLGKTRKCISVIDALLRGIMPYTVYLRNLTTVSNNSARCKLYQEVIHPQPIPLSLKMKRGCVADIEIIRSTFLWPAAISLEIESFPYKTKLINVPALVYLYFLRFLCFEMRGDGILKMEALSNLSVISYDDEHNDGSFLSYNIIGICHERVRNYLEAVEMFVHAAKDAKTYEWMNENMNPCLLRIGIVLNKKFSEER
ncbi:uncharacterized protein LOC128182657 [Crassostrea angulata]|uniref:uncharacterized protein LOC128182657 n=1 Tax=Magallana angulata TaxID=2784310 RepID=UPI0022B1B148|nr:uncharacterized protein LOC128182657 [Crassostrea angulata]